MDKEKKSGFDLMSVALSILLATNAYFVKRLISEIDESKRATYEVQRALSETQTQVTQTQTQVSQTQKQVSALQVQVRAIGKDVRQNSANPVK